MNTLTLVTYLDHEMELMPVGPLMLATLARQRGWEVFIVDLPPTCGEEALAERLSQSTCVGLSTLCTTFHRSLRLAGMIKARNPQVLVIMGGPQASAVAIALLQRHDCVDLVFRGEAETGWSAFLDHTPWEAIPGLVYRDGHGAVRETPPAPLLMELDQLPLPAFDLYRPFGLTVPLETGRGCPFRCVYCSTNHYFSRCFRAKSPQRILTEMDSLHALYGVRVFDLINDSFITQRKAIGPFCDAMRNHGQRYSWNISARPDQVNADLLNQLRASGCMGIYFGIETGSQRLQKVVRKNLRVTQAMENVLLTRAAGLMPTVSFIIGFPDETPDDLNETLRAYALLAAQREVVLQLHLLSPLAGSSLVAAQTPLAFDNMPTDFNDSDASIHRVEPDTSPPDSDLFPHRYHFHNAHIPRGRYLFVAYAIQLGQWHLPNFLQQVSLLCEAEWNRYLLTTPVPDAMVNDPLFPHPAAIWIERVGAVGARFTATVDQPGLAERLAYDLAYSRMSHLPSLPPIEVRLPRLWSGRVVGRFLPQAGMRAWSDVMSYLISQDEQGRVTVAPIFSVAEIEARLQTICGPCGECCLDDDGLMCGTREWERIARFLTEHQQQVPPVTPMAWPGLVMAKGERFLAHSEQDERTLHPTLEEARLAAGEQGWVRPACTHLEWRAPHFHCAIQEVKSAECLAFPYRPMGDGGQAWHLELSWGKRCDLTQLLQKEPHFRSQYTTWVKSRLDRESGATALGRFHATENDQWPQRA